MAIDMTTVKAISYNNKDVVKIEDGQGRVLWQSGPSWHTVWEGTQTITAPSIAGSSDTRLVYLGPTTDVEGTKLRITFSNINASGDSFATGYNIFNSSTSAKPTSPREGNVSGLGSASFFILGAYGGHNTGIGGNVNYKRARLLYKTSDGYIYTNVWTEADSGSSTSATLTITKIEWYY